jgi:hypothetical protein
MFGKLTGEREAESTGSTGNQRIFHVLPLNEKLFLQVRLLCDSGVT